MNTQALRESFEKDHPKPSDAIFREDWNAYVWSEYPNTHHKYNDVWLAYQSGCAASAERIQELERQLAEIDEPKEVTSKGCNFCTHPLYAGVVCHICGTVK
mgnify:CR=1 FL=1